jgi:hypothetical protein
MRTSEAGAGRIKAIFTLLFVAVVIFLGIKIIPVFVNNYQLQDDLRTMAINATVQFPPPTVEAVKANVVTKARDLGLPVTEDEVSVTLGHTATISVDYKVPVDLSVYTLVLHFTPSAENSKII